MPYVLRPISALGRQKLRMASTAVSVAILKTLESSTLQGQHSSSVTAREGLRAEIAEHHDYLCACAFLGVVQPFLQYASWLTQVWAERGLAHWTASTLVAKFAHLWREHLGEPDLSALEQFIEEAYQATPLMSGSARVSTVIVDEPDPSSQLLTDILLAGDRLTARNILLERLKQGHDLIDVGERLLQPAMYEIGHRWETNRVTIAQEHLASALTQSLMAHAFTQANFAPPAGRKVVFTCVEGNDHTIGLRMVSDAFEVEGWDVHFLGSGVPTDALIEFLDLHRPELVGLSITMHSQVAAAKRVIGRLKAELGTATAIMIGGLAPNQLGSAWKDVGADIWGSSARAALREAS